MIREITKAILPILLIGLVVSAQTKKASLTVQTTPNASIWIDDVFRGKTDGLGKLKISPIIPRSKIIRVRADGFAQVSKKLVPGIATLKIRLVPTFDPAELAFQEAERTLSKDKMKAIELYEKATSLRKNYAEAYVALARALIGIDNVAAHEAINRARKARPIYPEASAVEGRIYRDESEFDNAIESFDRAVKEGRGFQPEALTGLALLFEEEAKDAKLASEYEDEEFFLNEAAKSFEQAIDQLAATEPIVYFLLGEVYESMKNSDKAIAVYERFVNDFPDSESRSAAESIIEQLRIAGDSQSR